MAKSNTTSTKIPRYTISGTAQELFTTSSTKEANEKIFELQDLKCSVITITDIKYETTYEYSKSNHQKNYRIRSVAYSNPNLKPEFTNAPEQ